MLSIAPCSISFVQPVNTVKPHLTWAFFELSVMGGHGTPPPNHNFVVIAPVIMKFGTGIKLDLFYTMVAK